MSGDESREQVMKETEDLFASMSHVPLPLAGQGEPSGSLREWLEGFLVSQADKGQVVTPIMRLPERIGAALRECLTDARGYPTIGGALAVEVLVKNATRRPLKVITGQKYHPERVQVNRGGIFAYAEGSSGRTEVLYREVAPGETTTLSASAAIHSLYQHTKSAFDPALWGESAAIPQSDDLVEVGYRAKLNGGEVILGGVAREEAPKPAPSRRARRQNEATV